MSSTMRSIQDMPDMNDRTVLVRIDLNVPMEGGNVTDDTRIRRVLPTIRYLSEKGARVVLLSHFDRPKGKFVPSMSMAPLVDVLAKTLDHDVQFGVDCIGSAAQNAVQKLNAGDIVLLENVRFHAGEEGNDANFARELASLGDAYVNDAFSCSHRAHASVAAITQHLPSYAGELLRAEVEALTGILSDPKRPLTAIIGGSKVSTKLELLENLITKVDTLIIGGAMANTFLAAQGHDVGKSLCENALKTTAKRILKEAEKKQCRILLPVDAICATTLERGADCRVLPVQSIPLESMIVDVGPLTIVAYAKAIEESNMLVWNGPVGAFELAPFDCGTVSLARLVAGYTTTNNLVSIAGGGDTVAALTHAGLESAFSYLSTAGGAFLEWLEGKELPGIAALCASAAADCSRLSA